MARDGSGNYNLPTGQPVTTGTVISSTVHNTFATDVATALTASLAKDGQTTPTANLPMGTFKHTGVGDGTARTHYASLGQVMDGSYLVLGSVAGTVDAITANLTPAITSYPTGLEVRFISSGANTSTTPTIALNGLTAKTIVKTGGALVAGDISSGGWVILSYNGTNFVLLNPANNVGYASSSYTGTLTGCTTSPTASVKYAKIGNMVVLTIPILTATSNAATMSITGMPSEIRPAAVQNCAIPDAVGVDNSVALRVSAGKTTTLRIQTSGTIDFYIGDIAGSWTGSGTKGIGVVFTVAYLLT